MLEDFATLRAIYGDGFDAVYPFAAQARVRYRPDNPRAYLDANLTGTFNLLELMRHVPPAHALLASTSSGYGANAKVPVSRNRSGRSSLDALCRLEKGERGDTPKTS